MTSSSLSSHISDPDSNKLYTIIHTVAIATYPGSNRERRAWYQQIHVMLTINFITTHHYTIMGMIYELNIS